MLLSLSLLGVFQASLNGQPLTEFYSNKVRALLAYLAEESEQQHPRPVLAALLWPEWDDRAALGNLRFSLSKLRQAIHDPDAFPPFLLISRDRIQLNPAASIDLDVRRFQRELRASQWQAADGDEQSVSVLRSAVEHLQAAMNLYRGPFLEGFSPGDSVPFEEWAQVRREEHEREARGALHGLTALYCRLGDYAAAEQATRRILRMDPWDEAANRRLLSVLLATGQRNAALRHYAAYQEELARELSCEPEEETQALYAQIRVGALPQPQPSPATLSVPLEPARFATGSPSLPRVVAREQELDRLGYLLDGALDGRGGLALIAGEAGAGKTTLLDEFTRRASRAHARLIALRGHCNDYAGAGDLYLPFREIFQMLAGEIEGRRDDTALTQEQNRRVWETMPAVGTLLVEHGPDLIDRFVPGKALLRHAEGFPAAPGARRWQAQIQEIIRRNRENAKPAPHTGLSASAPQPDLLHQVTEVLRALSNEWPLLLAVDDLQWADSGTLALLFHLGRRLAGSRILLVCAYRPEALHGHSGLGTVAGEGDRAPAAGIGEVLEELRRDWGDVLIDLDEADGRAFVEAYVDSEPNCLGAAFRQALYNHTGGNPLFTVELLRSYERDGALAKDGSGRWVEAARLDWSLTPPRVEAVIARRLAALPEKDRMLLQAASVQGEEFVAEIAAQVLGWSEETVIRQLSGPLRTRQRLVQAFSLERIQSNGKRLSHYRFHHALVQRGAYHSLDMVEQARLHEATGMALESIYAAEAEKPQSLAVTLARHFEAASLRLQAARALHDAGVQAFRLSANREALSLFDHGLALLVDEPASPERMEIEQLLEAARLSPLRNRFSLGSAELEGALRQAIEAGAGKAQGWLRLQLLQAEIDVLFGRGKFEAARTAAEGMLAQAIQSGDAFHLVLAHWYAGFVSNVKGDPLEAESHFEWCLDWLVPQRRAEFHAAVGSDLLVYTLACSALNAWLLGYPQQAQLRTAEAVSAGFELGDRYGQAFATAIGSTMLFLLRGDEEALKQRSELCCRLCQEQGFPMWQAYATVFLGWLAVMRGDDAGIEQMQSTITRWQAAGMAIGTDSLVMVLADGCLAAARRRPAGGDISASAERRRLLSTGLAAIEPLLGPQAPCGQSYQAELHRLRGELLLEQDALDSPGEAIACFQHAIELGRKMGTLSWELRAAMSLVRLRMRQGEAYAAELAEARQFLRDLYARFTEGFKLPDLREAAALIDETTGSGEIDELFAKLY